MRKHSAICEPWDVVVVPFPFADRRETKRRPALCLSNRSLNQHGNTILAMITSAEQDPWPGDHLIEDAGAAGLRHPCRVRLKLFTLDNRLIIRQIGSLAPADRKAVAASLRSSLAALS